jgi:rSAM/selenodomain-associated transferase 2
MPPRKPDLSIIIPLLNEQDNIAELVRELLAQRDILLEVILVDGGSTDGSYELCCDLSDHHPDLINCLQSDTGRARQMNLGAQYARADELLFLHADTRLQDDTLLQRALTAINEQRQQHPGQTVAGHFALRFLRSQPGHDGAYFFYEAKTHLNRPDTINGDQGYWLARDFFLSLGQFDESLPYMEDARLATKIFTQGHWITLPGVIYSSARRFESEGLRQRQILNSFICNFQHIGLHDFFIQAREAYQAQDNTTTLQLKPFLRLIHGLMMQHGLRRAWQRWYQTGGYIAGNAWQLAFAADCRQARRAGKQPGNCGTKRLDFYDKWLAGLVTSAPCRAITAGLTLIWFYSLFVTEN